MSFEILHEPPTFLLMGRKGFLRYSVLILFSLQKLLIPSSYMGVLVISKPNYFFKMKKPVYHLQLQTIVHLVSILKV